MFSKPICHIKSPYLLPETKAFPIQREVMLVETIPSECEGIPFCKQVMPVEIHIYVCILVRNVWDALSVRQCILSAACCPLLFLVAGVKVIERTSQIEPVAVTVSQRHIEPFCLYPAMVGVASIAGAAYGRQVTFDVVLGVTVDDSSFHIQPVFA